MHDMSKRFLPSYQPEISADPQILGGIDAQKVQSCMTLFDAISPGDVFEQVLDTFYAGWRCELTLEMLDE